MKIGARKKWCPTCGEILVYHFATHENYDGTVRLNGAFYCLACETDRRLPTHPREENL